MCVPLRSGMTCPFFIGDELNAEGSVFDAQFGKALPTVISMHRIEQPLNWFRNCPTRTTSDLI